MAPPTLALQDRIPSSTFQPKVSLLVLIYYCMVYTRNIINSRPPLLLLYLSHAPFGPQADRFRTPFKCKRVLGTR